MEVRSCTLWRMDLCKQAREQNGVFVIFQNLHIQYSTKIQLKDVIQCPVKYTSFRSFLCALNLGSRIYDNFYLCPQSVS